MSVKAIKARLQLNRDSITPIYQQLQECLKEFIQTNPGGTRLPSERDLAEELGISRQTVNMALNYFLDKKLIVRNGRKGTFTAPDEPDKPSRAPLPELDFSKVYPLNFNGYYEFGATQQLRILLFENLPSQKNFWDECVRLFNHQRHYQAEIVYLPRSLSLAQAPDYAESMNCDLVQSCSYHLTNPALLAPLPPELVRQLADPSSCWSECLENAPAGLLDKYFPVYIVFWSLFANLQLWEQCGLGDFEHSGEQNLLEVLPHYRQRVPEDIFLAETPCAILAGRGFHAGYTKDTFRRDCESIRALSRFKNIFYGIQNELTSQFAAFVNGTQLLYPAWSNYLLIKLPNLPTRLRQTPIWPEPGNLASACASSFLSICKFSRHREEAQEFLHFLFSDAIQHNILSMMNVIPLKRSILPEFQRLFPQYTLDECEKFITLHRQFTNQPLAHRLQARLYRELQQLANGLLTVDETVAIAEEKQIFLQGTT
ncbi:GntR family transcriptional regulator [Victivallis sp. Marseille-Q1083]|uniref:GntR family transcriptional regulator n=1 Tax=Victivallis sp. Marseille-Q1083 TaxID=2717288 RepID=UPI0015888C1F|nr:GntR family transcriptional regulator [Victivallis sp. Marseille-Q1083]